MDILFFAKKTESTIQRLERVIENGRREKYNKTEIEIWLWEEGLIILSSEDGKHTETEVIRKYLLADRVSRMPRS